MTTCLYLSHEEQNNVTSRRTFILIVAIAIGALAAYVLWSYIQGVEDDLNQGAERAAVYMVVTEIPEDTRGDDARRTSIELREIPNDIKPANAVTELSQIDGKVAASTMVANEIVKVGDFIDPVVKQTSFSDLLPEGMVTVSLSVNRVAAAGGFLAPGDEANMMILHDGWNEAVAAEGEELSEDEKELNEAIEETIYQQPARYFYQKVKIMAIDDRLAPRAGDAVAEGVTVTGGGIITIAAPPAAALKIMSVPSASVVFNLLPDGYEAQVFDPVTAEELLDGRLPGEIEEFLTPYGPEGWDAFIDGDGEGVDTDPLAFDPDNDSSIADSPFGGGSSDSGNGGTEEPAADESGDATVDSGSDGEGAGTEDNPFADGE